FEQEPWSRSAIAVRRWDDAAKVPGLAGPGLDHYRPCLEAVLSSEVRSRRSEGRGQCPVERNGSGLLFMAPSIRPTPAQRAGRSLCASREMWLQPLGKARDVYVSLFSPAQSVSLETKCAG